MRGYVVRRLLELVPVLLGVTLVTFLLMYAAGGDAVTAKLENQGAVVTQDLIDAERHELGLDRPVLVQYGDWLAGFLAFDMGESYVSGESVAATFASKLPATLVLMLASIAVTVLVSTPLGVLTAVKRNRAVDYLIRVLCFVGNSLPNFFLALLLVYVFAVVLGWLPAISSASGEEGLAGVTPRGAVLPVATLSIAMTAKYTRQIRAAVLDELSKPYVEGALARGVDGRRVLLRNVLKCCASVVVTLLALSVGDLLGGAAVVETIFEWDGVGKLAVDSIAMRDYPMIQAYVAWMAVIYVIVNLVADLVCHRIDPRLRLTEASS